MVQSVVLHVGLLHRYRETNHLALPSAVVEGVDHPGRQSGGGGKNGRH